MHGEISFIRLTGVAGKNTDSSAERSQPQEKTCLMLGQHVYTYLSLLFGCKLNGNHTSGKPLQRGMGVLPSAAVKRNPMKLRVQLAVQKHQNNRALTQTRVRHTSCRNHFPQKAAALLVKYCSQ